MRIWVLMATFFGTGVMGAIAEPELERMVFEKAEMGVPFRITLYAPTAEVGRLAAEAVFERVEGLNSIYSDYDPESELSRLSHQREVGIEVPVSRALWEVLERCQEVSRQSEGAFDVTVGPLVNLWRRARRKQELPAMAALEEARQRVGYNKLRLNAERQSAQLLEPEMRLDLGGIAKGVAVDAALAVLKEHGIERALVAASGDLGASEAPPGKPGWRVEVSALDVEGAPEPRYVWLRHSAVSTAGDTFQRVEIGGVRYSHIVDPRTGIGVTDHSLNTVLAADCTTTDALETTLAVLGPARGLELIARTPGTAAYIVRQPKDRVEVFESPRWKELAEPR